jgi:hypothetical protein
MATPSHLHFVERGMRDLPHEDGPARGESEHDYFLRLVKEIRRHERAERRSRVVGWLLGREADERGAATILER